MARSKVDDLYEACGSLMRLPKVQRIQQMEWLLENISRFDPAVLKTHYGLFLHLLRTTGPTRLIASVLIEITDASMVTQGRVDLVCGLYKQKNSHSVSRLLRKMRDVCPADVYIPPLGQREVSEASVPLTTALAFAGRQTFPPETRFVSSVRANTATYFTISKPLPDEEFAGHLAALVPLVEQSGRVFTALERQVYEYLATTWQEEYKCGFTVSLFLIAAKLFRFWPQRPNDILLDRLLNPLKLSQGRMAEFILPHLWHFGAVAEPVVSHLVKKHEQQAFLFYATVAKAPDNGLVKRLIIHNCYLFLCSPWAQCVPDVCATLQGDFSLLSPGPKQILTELVAGGSDVLLSGLFNVNNSPWVGSYPQLIFNRLAKEKIEGSGREVVLIDPAVLLSHGGSSYPEFYQRLVVALESAGLRILPYLS